MQLVSFYLLILPQRIMELAAPMYRQSCMQLVSFYRLTLPYCMYKHVQASVTISAHSKHRRALRARLLVLLSQALSANAKAIRRHAVPRYWHCVYAVPRYWHCVLQFHGIGIAACLVPGVLRVDRHQLHYCQRVLLFENPDSNRSICMVA